MLKEAQRVIKRGRAKPVLTRFNYTLHALHNFPCERFHPLTMWYCRLAFEAALKTPLCYITLLLLALKKAIVMIDCGHMWRLWSGYIAALNGITLIIGSFSSAATKQIVCCFHSDMTAATLITTLCFWSLAAAWKWFSAAGILFIAKDKAVFVLDSSADGLLTFFPLE